MSCPSEKLQTASNLAREKKPNISVVASSPSGGIPRRALKHVVPLKQLRGKHTDQFVVFLLKVAALEAVRRISKARCPVVWRVIQALQVLGCPPFKWIQRWGPLGIIVKAVQDYEEVATELEQCRWDDDVASQIKHSCIKTFMGSYYHPWFHPSVSENECINRVLGKKASADGLD